MPGQPLTSPMDSLLVGSLVVANVDDAEAVTEPDVVDGAGGTYLAVRPWDGRART